MVPGVALFYAGVATKRHSLSMAWLPIMTTAVVGVQVSTHRLVPSPTTYSTAAVVPVGTRHCFFELAYVNHLLGRHRWNCSHQCPSPPCPGQTRSRESRSSSTRVVVLSLSRHVRLLHVCGPVSCIVGTLHSANLVNCLIVRLWSAALQWAKTAPATSSSS